MADDVPTRRQPAEPQDIYWAPNRYPDPDWAKEGAWREILLAGKPIGLIWTDFADGVGITWVTQTPEAVQMATTLQRMATIHAPASAAYVAAAQDGAAHGSLGDQQVGPLSQAKTEYNRLHAEA